MADSVVACITAVAAGAIAVGLAAFDALAIGGTCGVGVAGRALLAIIIVETKAAIAAAKTFNAAPLPWRCVDKEATFFLPTATQFMINALAIDALVADFVVGEAIVVVSAFSTAGQRFLIMLGGGCAFTVGAFATTVAITGNTDQLACGTAITVIIGHPVACSGAAIE